MSFDFLQNNALSRAELSNDGEVMNVHYGDILVKYGEVLDIAQEELTYLQDSSIMKKYQTSLLRNGDVIIADAAEDETVGKCSEIAGLSIETVLSGLHTIPCRPAIKFAEGYLGYYMNSDAYHDQLLPLIQGTKISSISKSAIQDTEIVYPKSEKEQTAISTYFKHLDNLITLHQRKYESLVNIKKAMLEKIFPKNEEVVPELRFAGFTDTWEQRKLSDVCSEIGDGLHSAPVYDENGKYYFINGNNLVNSKIIVNETETKRVSEETFKKNNKNLDDTTILLSINGTIGNLAYYNDEMVMLGKSAAYLKVMNIEKKFLYTSLQTSNTINSFMSSLTGTTIKNLGLEAIKKTQIFMPCEKEQTAIGKYFQNLDNLITLHQRELEKLQNIKKSCLEKMFI